MISVCILVKNGEKTLASTLDSVKDFPEVLLLDTGSSDRTLEIAKRYPNVKIYESPFYGFGPLRNDLAKRASHDWILALDSDEVLPPSLVKEILTISLDPQIAYAIPRHNFYQGQRIRGCGWGGEKVVRLYHRAHAQFSSAQVHESLQAKITISFRSPLHHTPYLSTEDFLHKMQQYSSLFAKQYQHQRRSSFAKALGRAVFTFFRSYIIKKGILDGSAGFTISLYNANTTFYKYLKLREANLQGIFEEVDRPL